MRESLVLLLAVSCGDAEPPEDTAPAQTCSTELTWENWGYGFFQTWCLPCHTENLISDPPTTTFDTPDPRYGAPTGVDFDTYADVVQWRERILTRVTDDNAPMPPGGGGLDPDTRDLIVAWLSCGMPIGESPPTEADPCEPRLPLPGPATLSAQTLCGVYNAVDGDLTVDTAVGLECLCDVSGDLVLDASAPLDAPRLHTVGGDLITSPTATAATMNFPALETVGGAVDLSLSPSTVQVELPELTSVGGDFTASGGGLANLWLRELGSVGGSLTLSDLDTVASVDLARIASVGGSLRIERNPALAELLGGTALVSVAQDVVLADLPSRTGELAMFDALTHVPGNIEITRLDGIESLQGFYKLETVGGHLWIQDNASLLKVSDFYFLASVGGALAVEGNALLETVNDFPLLSEVGLLGTGDEAELRVSDNPRIFGFPGLGSVMSIGTLRIERNGLGISPESGLGGIPPFAGLTTVLGDVIITDNTYLLGIDALTAIDSIGGDVIVSDNEALFALLLFADAGVGASIDGDLTITNLGGLNVLTIGPRLGTVGGDLTVSGNHALKAWTGPINLASVGGTLAIKENADLSALAGFDDLESVGSLLLESNPELFTYEGMGSLETVAGDLHVDNCDAMTHIDALSSVDLVFGHLWLEENASLSDLDGLQGLTAVGGDLRIVNNPDLDTDDAQLLADALGANIGGEVVITGNGP